MSTISNIPSTDFSIPSDLGRSNTNHPSTSKSPSDQLEIRSQEDGQPEPDQGSGLGALGSTAAAEITPRVQSEKFQFVLIRQSKKSKGKWKEIDIPMVTSIVTRGSGSRSGDGDDSDSVNAGLILKTGSSSKRRIVSEDDEDDDYEGSDNNVDELASESVRSKVSTTPRAKKRSKSTRSNNPSGIRVKRLAVDPRDDGKNWPAEEGDVVFVSVELLNGL
jgi:hypothetical protein